MILLIEGLAAFLLIGTSGVFSAVETAFLSLSRLDLERLDRVAPGRLSFWRRDPERVLAVIVLGNNMANAGLGVLAVDMALESFRVMAVPFRWGEILFPASAAVALVVWGEVLPKVWTRAHAPAVALALARPMEGLVRWAGPALEGLVRHVRRLLSWMSTLVSAERVRWDLPVIRSLVENSPATGPFRHVLKNLLDFGNLPVSRVMVPREEIFSLNIGLPPADFLRAVLASGYTRVPVHRGDPDRLEGFVHAKDLLAQKITGRLLVLEDLLRPLPRVSPGETLAPLLRNMRREGYWMVRVGSPQGRTEGLVTLEDILESIVGEIPEEPPLPLPRPPRRRRR
jgi:CBS domain containing-hemolysin-like protein